MHRVRRVPIAPLGLDGVEAEDCVDAWVGDAAAAGPAPMPAALIPAQIVRVSFSDVCAAGPSSCGSLGRLVGRPGQAGGSAPHHQILSPNGLRPTHRSNGQPRKPSCRGGDGGPTHKGLDRRIGGRVVRVRLRQAQVAVRPRHLHSTRSLLRCWQKMQPNSGISRSAWGRRRRSCLGSTQPGLYVPTQRSSPAQLAFQTSRECAQMASGAW